MQITKKGNTLTITCELQPPRPSSTGKTNILFTTGGFTPVQGENGMKVNLTVVTPKS